MALVGEPELSMFLSGGHHNPIQHHLMDWSTGPEQGGHMLSRGLNQNEEISSSSYMTSLDPYHHPHSFSISNLPPQTPFDLSENFHTPKVEPNSDEYDYYPSSQVNSQRSYHSGGGGSFVPQQQVTNPYSSQSPVQLQPQHGGSGGTLEEIDGLLKNISDVPQQQQQQQHQDLDMDRLLYSELVSLQQPQQHSMYGSHASSLGPVRHGAGLGGGGPVVSQQHTRNQWMDAQAVLLARELQESIMADNSSMDSSDNSAMTFGGHSEAAMNNFYSEVARGHHGAGSSNWSVSGSLKVGASSPTAHQHQQQMVLKQQQHSAVRMSTSLGGYAQPDPDFFLRPPAASGFGSSSSASPLSLHELQNARLSTNAHLSQLTEQILPPGTIVPATGLQLVHLLLACAEAVAENKLKDAEVILARLRQHVLPDGNPMQRLAAYFEQALTARLTKENSSPIFKGLTGDRSIPQAEVLEAFSVYYDCIPIGKFGHLTCNQILLDAVEREKVVHVLDLHIWHGMQWPAFLQALALRPGGPPKLRLSAVGSEASDLQETGEKLHECAKNLSVPFEFCPVLTSLEDFNSDMVEMRRGEALVVNSFVQFHGILNKGPNSLNILLGDLRRLNPRIMAFAENDGNHNSNSFLTRFVECLRYYSAVFDAFDASLPPDSPARMKMEQIFAAQKIRNIIACEGPARVDGHETMKYWHKRMEGAHFRCVPLSTRAVSQANLLLNLYYSNGYTLNTSECGYLALGWHGMPLMGVSAWH